jgi:protein-disulfide isomerase
MIRIFAMAALCAMPIAAHAQDLTQDQIKALVLETIRENPSIVVEALQAVEAQQQQAQAAAARANLAALRDTLENDPNAVVLGNPDGDVTIVEFFDYNCPYCRNAKSELAAVLAADPNVRVVLREWPILGEGSVFAARAALAARAQGQYPAFHAALMNMQGRAEEQSVIRVAQSLGLDIDQLRRDMDAPEILAHVQTSQNMGRALGFTGTPSFVIGDAVAPGMIGSDQIAAMIAQARAAQ